MRVEISSKHLSISHRLAAEMNLLSKKFNYRDYSKIEDIDNVLLNRNISVEAKKRLLIGKLHSLIAKAFAIDKRKITKNGFSSLASRLLGIRKVVMKLRSLNQYMETMFLADLNFLQIKIPLQNRKLDSGKGIIKNELEALEYTAYQLIGEAVMLDKRLLSEYKHKEKKMLTEEKAEIRDLGMILRKESEALEHLEAKIPPPRHLPFALMKDPLFTQWVSRVLALLSYIEHLYSKETGIFRELKKSKPAKIRIGKKIIHLAKERSKLLDIMEEKMLSMGKIRLDSGLKRELRNLTATITL
jgi:hypothetical protein